MFIDREYSVHPIEISPAEAWEKVQSRHAIIIDVRFEEELEAMGFPPGSVHLPLSFLQRFCGDEPEPCCPVFSLRDLRREERSYITSMLLKYAHERTSLLCICMHGNRSLAAAHVLRNLGYPLSSSISGGMSDWILSDLPVSVLR